MAHSALGPSKAKQWINCPGSILLSKGVPPRPTSYEAAEGHVAHDLAERHVTGKLDLVDLMAMVGTTVKNDGHDIKVIDEMVDGAADYKALIDSVRAELLSANKPKPVEEHAEKRVHARSVDEEVWGTTDYAMWIVGHRIDVIDYKFGEGVIVDPEENEQAVLYLLGILDSVVKAGTTFDEMWVWIHQPRGRHAAGPIRKWRVPAQWLEEFRARAKKSAELTRVPGSPLAAGDWCRWCPANPCVEINKRAQEAAMVAFDDNAPKMPDLRSLPIEKVAQIVGHEDLVKAILSGAKDVLYEHLSSGKPLEGWKLVEGRAGNREWIDEKKVVELLTPKLGKEERLFKKELLSPTQMGKLPELKGFPLDELTMRKPGKKAIARDTDPRPVTATAAQDAFAVIDAEIVPEPHGPGCGCLTHMNGENKLPIPARALPEGVCCELKEALGECDGHKVAEEEKPKKRGKVWA
jgi:hypothetical protein